MATSAFLLSDKEILDVFPKEDFYVVFGTSHTAGWCERNNERIMSREHNWCSQLSKKLGKPVFNLALGGNTPDIMLEMVSEFVYYYNKQHAKCLGAIIEARAADHSVFFDDDEFIKTRELKDKHFEIASHHAITLGRDYITKNTTSNFYNICNIARQLNGPVATKYKDLTNDQLKWVQKTVEHTMVGAYIHFNCLNKLLRMTQILHAVNIPNYCFYWESEKVEGLNDHETYNMQKLYYSTVNAYSQRGLNFINWQKEKPLNKNSFHMLTEIERRNGIEFLNQNECACQHYNEKVSAEAAQILYEELQ